MCEKCPKREKCKTLCKKVKAHLRKSKIFSSDYVRPMLPRQKRTRDSVWREIPFSSLPRDEQTKIGLDGNDDFSSNNC